MPITAAPWAKSLMDVAPDTTVPQAIEMTPSIREYTPAISPTPCPKDAGAQTPEISIVSTIYQSRPFLDDFLAGCLMALRSIEVADFEIVLVNDGSPDESLAFALERQSDIPQLLIIDLARNFGHHHAMLAGLSHARGRLVFLIDCDLEVPPMVLPVFYNKLKHTGCDLVYGYQESRKGGMLERVSGGLFWKGFNLLSDTRVPENLITEKIMTRRFVDSLLQMGDRNIFLGGMISWTGFTQIGIPVQKKQRGGRSTYTLPKRLRLMVNAVSSFSSRPLVWLFNAGGAITLISLAYVCYLAVRQLWFGDAPAGFTSIMAFMAVSLGILTTAIGIVGIYLDKVFRQVQNRPTYIVKDIHRHRAGESNDQ
jgi:putative glycosyltransferase